MSESDCELFVKVQSNHCNSCKHHYEDHFTDGPYPRTRTCVCGMQKCCRNECKCFQYVPDLIKVPYVSPHKGAITTHEFDYSKLSVKLEDERDPQIKEYYPLVAIKGSLLSYIFVSDPSLDYLTKHTFDSGLSSGGAVNPVNMLARIERECEAIRRRAMKGRLWAMERYKTMGWNRTFTQLEACQLSYGGGIGQK